jgi:hypothetical protein
MREFVSLKNKIGKIDISEIEKIEIESKDQSLLTNLIHYIDYINYLFEIEVNKINAIGKYEWISGKREGTLEFVGRLDLVNSKTVNYQAYSSPGKRDVSGETKIHIYFHSNKLTIELGLHNCSIFINENKYYEFPIFIQSKDGGKVLKQILSGSEDILLPKFSQVYNQQSVIVRDFEKMFNSTSLSANEIFNIA